MFLSVLYADCDLIVVEKPAGIPAQSDPSGQANLLDAVKEQYPSAHLVHRLDTPTGGLMVFGLTQHAAAKLSALIQDHAAFRKEYLAVLSAPLPDSEGTFQDFLYHDKRQNKAFTVDSSRKGAKQATLTYRTLMTAEDGHTLVCVRLHTGRTHQIRVQFASRGLPLCGDGKYGSREKCPCIGLWAHRLTFPRPARKEDISAVSFPCVTDPPWAFFQEYLSKHKNGMTRP